MPVCVTARYSRYTRVDAIVKAKSDNALEVAAEGVNTPALSCARWLMINAELINRPHKKYGQNAFLKREPLTAA